MAPISYNARPFGLSMQRPTHLARVQTPSPLSTDASSELSLVGSASNRTPWVLLPPVDVHSPRPSPPPSPRLIAQSPDNGDMNGLDALRSPPGIFSPAALHILKQLRKALQKDFQGETRLISLWIGGSSAADALGRLAVTQRPDDLDPILLIHQDATLTGTELAKIVECAWRQVPAGPWQARPAVSLGDEGGVGVPVLLRLSMKNEHIDVRVVQLATSARMFDVAANALLVDPFRPSVWASVPGVTPQEAEASAYWGTYKVDYAGHRDIILRLWKAHARGLVPVQGSPDDLSSATWQTCLLNHLEEEAKNNSQTSFGLLLAQFCNQRVVGTQDKQACAMVLANALLDVIPVVVAHRRGPDLLKALNQTASVPFHLPDGPAKDLISLVSKPRTAPLIALWFSLVATTSDSPLAEDKDNDGLVITHPSRSKEHITRVFFPGVKKYLVIDHSPHTWLRLTLASLNDMSNAEFLRLCNKKDDKEAIAGLLGHPFLSRLVEDGFWSDFAQRASVSRKIIDLICDKKNNNPKDMRLLRLAAVVLRMDITTDTETLLYPLPKSMMSQLRILINKRDLNCLNDSLNCLERAGQSDSVQRFLWCRVNTFFYSLAVAQRADQLGRIASVLKSKICPGPDESDILALFFSRLRGANLEFYPASTLVLWEYIVALWRSDKGYHYDLAAMVYRSSSKILQNHIKQLPLPMLQQLADLALNFVSGDTPWIKTPANLWSGNFLHAILLAVCDRQSSEYILYPYFWHKLGCLDEFSTDLILWENFQALPHYAHDLLFRAWLDTPIKAEKMVDSSLIQHCNPLYMTLCSTLAQNSHVSTNKLIGKWFKTEIKKSVIDIPDVPLFDSFLVDMMTSSEFCRGPLLDELNDGELTFVAERLLKSLEKQHLGATQQQLLPYAIELLADHLVRKKDDIGIFHLGQKLLSYCTSNQRNLLFVQQYLCEKISDRASLHFSAGEEGHEIFPALYGFFKQCPKEKHALSAWMVALKSCLVTLIIVEPNRVLDFFAALDSCAEFRGNLHLFVSKIDIEQEPLISFLLHHQSSLSERFPHWGNMLARQLCLYDKKSMSCSMHKDSLVEKDKIRAYSFWKSIIPFHDHFEQLKESFINKQLSSPLNWDLAARNDNNSKIPFHLQAGFYLAWIEASENQTIYKKRVQEVMEYASLWPGRLKKVSKLKKEERALLASCLGPLVVENFSDRRSVGTEIMASLIRAPVPLFGQDNDLGIFGEPSFGLKIHVCSLEDIALKEATAQEKWQLAGCRAADILVILHSLADSYDMNVSQFENYFRSWCDAIMQWPAQYQEGWYEAFLHMWKDDYNGRESLDLIIRDYSFTESRKTKNLDVSDGRCVLARYWAHSITSAAYLDRKNIVDGLLNSIAQLGNFIDFLSNDERENLLSYLASMMESKAVRHDIAVHLIKIHYNVSLYCGEPVATIRPVMSRLIDATIHADPGGGGLFGPLINLLLTERSKVKDTSFWDEKILDILSSIERAQNFKMPFVPLGSATLELKKVYTTAKNIPDNSVFLEISRICMVLAH